MKGLEASEKVGQFTQNWTIRTRKSNYLKKGITYQQFSYECFLLFIIIFANSVVYIMNLRLIVFISFVIILSGCASTLRTNHMIVSKQDIIKYNAPSILTTNIMVGNISGVKEASSFLTQSGSIIYFDIKDANIKQALTESLKKAKLLGNDRKSQYILSANVISIDRDREVIVSSVRTTIEYKLIRVSDKKEILREIIFFVSEGKLDAVLALHRVRSSIERSIAGNISKLINRLYDLRI
uniref:Uncharacterized protein n=1 Tax=Candidatus Kentrum sp. LFY TaxID=2126342 RepID=A0A450X472_9GAMM|nr:MAG: hypothetical protein BECKLFY1418C_GA0070996_11651 [Candidatus Kentron sp. LFY]